MKPAEETWKISAPFVYLPDSLSVEMISNNLNTQIMNGQRQTNSSLKPTVNPESSYKYLNSASFIKDIKKWFKNLYFHL